MKADMFDRYTSTHMLADEDEAALTRWSAQFFRKFILPHLPANKDVVILDCGCGYGRYLKTLRESGYANSCGVDISAEQIAYARDTLGLTDVHCSDAIRFLDDRRGAYDVVLLMDVLEHLGMDDSIRLILTARNGLKDGGELIVVAPNALTPMNIYRYSDLTHLRSYTVRSLGQSLRLGGFEQMSFFPLPPVVHGVASGIRRMLWDCFINPAILVLVRLCHGPSYGGIFTGNLLAVARKTGA